MTRARVALGFLCVLGACRPTDATLGGAWNCPEADAKSCFFFDSALQTQSTSDSVRAQFEVPVDPDAAKQPSVAYPLDGTTEPSNIYDLDIQWRRPRSEQKLFRIRVESPALPYGRYDLYTQCFPKNDGCHYNVPEDAWATNVTNLLKGQDALLTVAASDGQGGEISVSPAVHLRFTYAPVPGGLYYWSAHPPNAPPGADDQGTTFRLAFGARRAEPFIRPGLENPDKCEGCHSVSGDGTTIAYTATSDNIADGAQAGSFIAQLTVEPTLKPPPFPIMSDHDSAMVALNYPGTLAIVGVDNTLGLRDVKDGTTTPIDPSLLGDEKQGYFPDFSPDQKHIVVTLSNKPDSPWAVTTGSIATLDFDLDSRTFSAAKVLVPMTDTEFHYYPSWSPDNQWIVFASAPRGPDLTRCSNQSDVSTCLPNRSYDQPNSRLRLVHFPDGRVYDLGHATQGVGFTSTLPKFAPLPTDGHNQLFITFNSKLNYGVEVSNSPAQLWLSVLDFDRLPDDPSSAPVWLPFQTFGQKNHLAYWTDKVRCRADHSEPACGTGEVCSQDGVCFVPPR
ncbi:MAG TPA: hypothetical protein VHW01_07485 [Polyangiaceae bacterium]|jgi:hypothetical protein|nr:hypothetical protein [Polyangiaceae bacterium]